MDKELEEFYNGLSPIMHYKIVDACSEDKETLNEKYTKEELQEIYYNIDKLNKHGHFEDEREKLLEIAFENGE